MKNKRAIIVQVRLTQKESVMVDALSNRVYGEASRPDVIRRCVVERFNKAFPQYVQQRQGVGTPDEDLTKEQICEMLGGTVSRNDSGPVCLFVVGHSGKKVVSLSLMGEKGEVGDYRIRR